jgi:hypothetical protein
MSTVNVSLRRIVDCGLAEAGRVVGCTGHEIAEIRVLEGGRLPRSYEQFMEVAGRSAGLFYSDMDFFYPAVLKNKGIAEDLLAEASWKLKQTEFPFGSHHGYTFLFFDASLGDDPPVSNYLEGDPGPRVVAPSFSAWLAGCVEDERELYFGPP